MQKFQIKKLFVIASLSFSVFAANAKSTLNSMCYVQNKPGAKIEGEKANDLFEVASVSKVFTSFWAVHKLGPYYRFATEIYITPVDGRSFDVHIAGSQDPYWGRQLSHFLFAELNRNGVTQIRRLTFDENFSTRWNVLTDFIETLNPSADDIAASFVSHIKNLNVEYSATFREAARAQILLPGRLSLSVAEVAYQPSTQFQRLSSTRAFVLKSAPLYQYLKEMNRVSNNHVADKIFDFLGGVSEFKKFTQETMQASSANIRFINGSGNSVLMGIDANGRQLKDYNRASCETLVRVLMRLQQELKATQKLDLTDVLAVASSDDSTLAPRYDTLSNSLVAKTGTVDPAITLAGMISTAQGDVYFGYLYSTDGPADWNTAKDRIRDRVFDLVRKFGGRKAFTYSPTVFTTFDKGSYFSTKSSLQLTTP